MALAAGTRLGPYEILGLIGAGGMGEVYRARDPHLDRDIAIKVLPAAAAADLDRRGRFEREAKAVAALNHPNIVTIHAVEQSDGVPFFTMEFVDGRTLGQLIPPHGFPLPELLRIAIPITDAVGAAHQRGILHRDLKPSNVMLTTEGRVKVLDFGLAKLKEAIVHDDRSLPTAEDTGEGRVLGTVAYMSPEQAEGKPLDQRSDVFDLGILLYEMATGQRPFKGDTSVSVISSILKDTPGSVTELRPDLPRDLARILKRALNKDPEHRYQTAKDLRNDLETLKEDLDSGDVTVTPARPSKSEQKKRRWVLTAALLVMAAGIFGAWWLTRLSMSPQPSPPARRIFDDFTVTGLTSEESSPTAVAVSPDGRYIAYASIDGGRQSLRVRQVETSAAVEIVPPADVLYFGVNFSPDGNRLYYIAYPLGKGQATLYDIPVLGGAPRRLIDDVDRGVTFAPDGSRLAFMRNDVGKASSIVIANVDGTGERVLVTRQVPNQFVFCNPAWSGDGRTMAAAVREGRGVAIALVDATTGKVETIGRTRWGVVPSIAWPANESHLIISAGDSTTAVTTQIWQVNLPGGEARRITKDIASYGRVSLTADGRGLVTVRSEPRGTLWVAPSARPDRLTRVPSVPDMVDVAVSRAPIRWTPDGQIVYVANMSGNLDLFSVRPDGSGLRQLTTSSGLDSDPSVSPDGRYVVFLSSQGGDVRVWRTDPDGGRQVALTDGPSDAMPIVTGDSRAVFFVRLDQTDEPVYSMSLLDRRTRATTAPSGIPPGFHPIDLSPDGTLLMGLYWIPEEFRTRIAIIPASGHGSRRYLDVDVSLGFGRSYAWAPDGRSITFAQTAGSAANLWRQRLDGGPPVRVTNYTEGTIQAHAWSRDGKLLAIVRTTPQGRVVLMRDVVGGTR